MGIRKTLSSLGAAAVLALSPQAAEASLTRNQETSETIEPSQSSGLKSVKDADQEESERLVDDIQKGKTVFHGGIVLNIEKLNQIKGKNDTLKNFDFVFEGNKVGLKFHDDGKRKWFDEDPVTYMVMMPREDFAKFLSAMFKKERKEKKELKRPEDPRKWKYNDPYPFFYVIDAKGNRKIMTDKKDAAAMYDKVIDTICEMHDCGVIDITKIFNSYEKEIKYTDFGKSFTGQAILNLVKKNPTLFIKSLASFLENNFRIFALNTDQRNFEKKLFDKEKAEATKKYLAREELEKKEREEAELKRQQGLVKIDKIDEIDTLTSYKDDDNSHNSKIYFSCNNKWVDIWVQNGVVVSDFMSGGGVNRRLEPEEWKQINTLLNKKLTDKQKQELGESFFKAIKEKENKKINLAMISQGKGSIR